MLTVLCKSMLDGMIYMGRGLLIINAEMIIQGNISFGDLRIKNGLIHTVAIGGGLFINDDEDLIDAEGLYLLPGVIDPQVHFREPGQPERENIATGSRAAASGGVTSFLDMPNNNPSAVSLKSINDKINSASNSAIANYGFFIGATPNNLTELQKAVGTFENPKNIDGICGTKIFMGSSTGDLLVNEQDALEKIFAGTGGVIAVHAEDEDRLNIRKPKFNHRTDVAAHAEWRDSETALIATKRAAQLSNNHSHKLHILHLTSGIEADWLANNKRELITTEVCPQHLTFDENDVLKRGTRLIMNPPIRYEEDRDKLWRRLKDGTIDCIATDHAPHTLENKLLGFPKAHAGMPGVETSLPIMLTHASEGKCSIPDVVRWMSEGPAKVYDIQNKGYIEEGKDADLVLINMEEQKTIEDRDVWSRVGWTPYAGMSMTGWPVFTIVEGVIVHTRDLNDELRGKSIVNPGSVGKPLKFGTN
mgnify:CR=1 FL=1